MTRHRMVMACRLPESVNALLRTEYDIDFIAEQTIPTADEVIAAAQGHDVVLGYGTIPMNRSFIERLPESVKALATYSVGYEHVDLEAARERGLAVFNTPGVLTDACAEVALLLMLGAARRATEAIGLIRSRQWKGWSALDMIGIGLTGKTLGIIGMGRIGQASAERARAFGMTIHYHNRSRLAPGQEEGAVYHGDVESLLAVSQFLLLACPANAETRGLLDARRIALLPKDAIVVNIGRGSVVNDGDLIAALQGGHLAAAGLDVFNNEPAIDSRYWDLPNVFIFPHIGSATRETRLAMGQILIDGLRAFWMEKSAENRLV